MDRGRRERRAERDTTQMVKVDPAKNRRCVHRCAAGREKRQIALERGSGGSCQMIAVKVENRDWVSPDFLALMVAAELIQK